MRSLTRSAVRLPLAVGAVTAAVLGLTVSPALANHPVFVEGNCFGPGAGAAATGLRTSPVPAGTCGDVDGDGRIGAAEDADGDNSYGTIMAAVNAVANNGKVTVVANGTYPEVVTLAPTNSASMTLEAAPGVDANIDAVVQGQAGNGPRQASPGIIINGDDTSRVTVRNIMTRNWTAGIEVRGVSHATIDDVRAESNVTYGINVLDRAKVAISGSDINASGVRRGATGPTAPDPGAGIEFEGTSRGDVYDTSITGSRGAGLAVEDSAQVKVRDVQSFDNRPNFLFSNRGRGERRDDVRDGSHGRG